MFAADCVQACTGVDPAVDMRGTYSDAIGAARTVDALGGLAAIAAAHAGPEVPVALAQPGDIGMLLNGGRECLGVCLGQMWQAPGAECLCVLPAAQVLRVWRLLKVS